MWTPVLLASLAELSERRGQLSRMSRLVRKVAFSVAIAAAALVGACVIAGGARLQLDGEAGDGRAISAVQAVVDDINWG